MYNNGTFKIINLYNVLNSIKLQFNGEEKNPLEETSKVNDYNGTV